MPTAMATSRAYLWVVWAVAIALAIGAGLGGRMFWEGRSDNSALGAAQLGGPFSLVTHTGAPITEADLLGSPSALFFGFTHCPEICPTTIFDINAWLEELGPQADALKVYFVTIDPERDPPEVLGDYVTAQSDRVTGISGPPDAVRAMADIWRVYYKSVPLDGDDYTMDHTSLIYLLDDQGQYAELIRYGEAHDRAIAKLRRLLNG
ncbi:MAG: SCO family protein [Rhodobacteraceae bacterium]|nr:SCO family protein [Paracoccaceae bacterium]